MPLAIAEVNNPVIIADVVLGVLGASWAAVMVSINPSIPPLNPFSIVFPHPEDLIDGKTNSRSSTMAGISAFTPPSPMKLVRTDTWFEIPNFPPGKKSSEMEL